MSCTGLLSQLLNNCNSKQSPFIYLYEENYGLATKLQNSSIVAIVGYISYTDEETTKLIKRSNRDQRTSIPLDIA